MMKMKPNFVFAADVFQPQTTCCPAATFRKPSPYNIL